MSLVVERFLVCDRCGENFGVDMRHRTEKEHRQAAKEDGWRRGRDGKDYCNECLSKYFINRRLTRPRNP